MNKSVETVLVITAAMVGLDDRHSCENHSVTLVEEMATVAYSERT
jgi:hypothetical protein